MPSPFNLSSQSQKNINQQPTPNNAEDFSLHTMQDDLLSHPEKTVTMEKIYPEPISETPKKQEPPKNVTPETAKPVPNQPVDKKQENFIENQKATGSVHDSSSKIYQIIFLLLFIAALVGGGGYYFWMTRKPPETIPQPQPIEEPVVIAPVQEKYSQEKPNFLPLDLTVLGPQEIRDSINAVALELKEKVNQKPYEFIVVDANNNPVAFPIFATAIKLNLSPDLLENLGEDFSLFFYSDNGYIRLSVLTTVKNNDIVAAEILKQEPTLVSDVAFLLLDAEVEKERLSGTFQGGTYNGAPIKYLNLDSQINLSIDYSIVENKLIIATSKNSMRAILDKLLTKDFIFINEQSSGETEKSADKSKKEVNTQPVTEDETMPPSTPPGNETTAPTVNETTGTAPAPTP